MNETEAASNLIKNIFKQPEFPIKRLESIEINWIEKYGEYFPDLKCTFYKKE